MNEKDKHHTALVTNETSANGLMFQVAFKPKKLQNPYKYFLKFSTLKIEIQKHRREERHTGSFLLSRF